MALGVYPEVSLLVARQRREEARKLLANDIDPSTAKRAEKHAQAAVASLRSMGYPKEVMTAHGFRATARTVLA